MESADLDRNSPVWRDKIVTGDISGSNIAIGAGAQSIVNYITQALSQVEEAEKAAAFEQKRLGDAVKTYVQDLQAQAEQAQEKLGRGNPYKGLLAYEFGDAALLYGRSAAIKAVLDCLERGRLTVLQADSGVGKTSLLKAGIRPRLLAEGQVSLYIRFQNKPVDEAIRRNLIVQLEQVPRLSTASLHDFLRLVTDLLGGRRLVVILDQFEEIFALQSEALRDGFVTKLAECLDDDLLPVWWILALRSESFGQLSTFQPQIKQPFANEYLLRAFTPDDAREIIVEPARPWNVTYETGLVERIIRELDQGGVPPPQLQLVCSVLFADLNGRQQITHAMYDDAGGASTILRNYLNHVLTHDVPPQQRQAALQLLEALVTSDKHRIPRTHDELVKKLTRQGIEEKTIDDLLRQLTESRLLRVAEQAELTYELVHDYLAEKLEIDPAAKERMIAQELLDRANQDYQQTKRSLISADRLERIEKQAQFLNLSIDELDLLFRSALAGQRSCEIWKSQAQNSGQVDALAGRWVMALEDETQAEAAIESLVSLSDPEAVSHLKRLIESQTPSGQDNPLLHSAPVQRRALIALAKMGCPEAKAYLAGLTLEGYRFVPTGQPEGDKTVDERLVQLPSFWIAHAPVMVQDWLAFMDAGAYVQPDYWKESGRRTTAPAGWQHQLENLEQPVGHLTWYDAMAHAVWKAEATSLPVELPTEAEWDKANQAQDMTSKVLEWTCAQHGSKEISGDQPQALCNKTSDPGTRRYALDPALALSNSGCRMCLRIVPLTPGP